VTPGYLVPDFHPKDNLARFEIPQGDGYIVIWVHSQGR
jgi:hypothetical protein